MKRIFYFILIIPLLFCFSCKKNSNENKNANKEKVVYLTFDDGPCSNTLNILSVLQKHQVKATFFVVGTMVEKHPEILKRIYNLGNSIGIHSYSHIYKKIYSSITQLQQDILDCKNAIVKVIPKFSGAIYRFPGGSFGLQKEKIEIVKNLGYTYYDWNASTLDAEGDFSPYEIFLNVKQTSVNKNKVILLAHDTKPNTALALNDIIRYFLENGFIFKTL